MDIAATTTAMRRAHKAFKHAERQLADASTARAQARHARRARNAQRQLREAQDWFEDVAMQAAD